MSDSEESSVPLSDVFGVLGNDTRIGIIRALAEESTTSAGFGSSLTFSQLRERVGVRDSGQFNYHLGKLTGHFVAETDEGYTLTYTGSVVYRTVVAGLFNPEGAVTPFGTTTDCLHCEATLEASYEDGLFRIDCPDCGREYMSWQFPPAAAQEWTGTELLARFDQYLRHHILLMNHDICIWCGGNMPPNPRTWTAEELTGGGDPLVGFERRCDHCGEYLVTTTGEAVLYHPATISFFYEHGVDVTDRFLWDLDFVVDPARTTVRSEDPWELAVHLTCDGDERTMVVDGNAEVTAVED